MCALYGKVEYWDARYQKTVKSKPCEWFRCYQQFSYLLTPSTLGSNAALSLDTSSATESSVHLNAPSTLSSPYDHFPDCSKARVLIMGCGNSSLPFDMFLDGWTGGIVGVDFSPFVVRQMREKCAKLHFDSTTQDHDLSQLLDFVCADVTKPLPGYGPGSFDLILCKGTLDAILCSEGSHANAKCFIHNCVELLSSQHGVLVLITTGNPDNRFEYLEYRNVLSYHWRNVSVHPLRNETTNITLDQQPPIVYCYICRKRSEFDCIEVVNSLSIPTEKGTNQNQKAFNVAF